MSFFNCSKFIAYISIGIVLIGVLELDASAPRNDFLTRRGNEDHSEVLINVNHVIDFLHTIKKSQDDMAQKVEILTKTVESSDREEYRSRVQLSRRISVLETKISEIERTLPLKMEEFFEKKEQLNSNIPSSSFSSFEQGRIQEPQHLLRPLTPAPLSAGGGGNGPRSSRDISYFEPFSGRQNFLRNGEYSSSSMPGLRSVADRQGYLSIHLLEDSKIKMNLMNETLESFRNKLLDVEKKIGNTERSNNNIHPKEDLFEITKKELENKFESNEKEVNLLKKKQGELRRTIDSVLIHFSTLVLGLEDAQKKISETQRNVSEEIERRLATTKIIQTQGSSSSSFFPQRNEIETSTVPAVVIESFNYVDVEESEELTPTTTTTEDFEEQQTYTSAPVWSDFNEDDYEGDNPLLPDPSALVDTRPSLKIPRNLLKTGGSNPLSRGSLETNEFAIIFKNLTNEVQNQREEIVKLTSNLAKINVSQILLMRTMDEETLKRIIRPKDCSEIRLFRNNGSRSGRYTIFPKLIDDPKNILCDLETDGGGWTIIQRRGQPLEPGKKREDFYRNWNEYETGFGSLEGDFWLGLSNIAALCKLGDQELRVEMTNWRGEKKTASYNHFRVGDAQSLYKIQVSDYYGDAGDSLSRHNGMAFSTKDKDHDTDRHRNCAQMWKGGWWYYGCHESNLNGLYGREENLDGSNEYGTGIIWYHWTGNHVSLKNVEIKIRNNFVVRSSSSS